MLDLVISGAKVVTPGGVGYWDIGVSDGTIALLGDRGSMPTDAVRVIDGTGRIAVPGGIDPHCHTGWTVPTAAEAGIVSAGADQVSRAAAYGGSTTLVDFAFWREPQTLQQSLEVKDDEWKGKSFVDYALHVTFKGEISWDAISQIPEAISSGHPTFKVWMTNTTPSRPRQMTPFGFVSAILEKTGKNGGLLCVHAEDDDLVMFEYERLRREGRWSFENVYLAHSNISEAISFARVIRLAAHHESALYLMHVSAKEGVDAIEEARARHQPVYGETLQHYISFTADDYRRPNGAIYHTYPSLKGPGDRERLWTGLAAGVLSTVATDEMCTDFATKIRGSTIDDVTGGHAGVEVRMAIMYTEAVAKRGFTLERFVGVTSTNAAKILGLYPRKGAIAVGSDADIVLIETFDPRPISAGDLHETDYSAWDGWEIQAWPSTTILRGIVLADRGELKSEAVGEQIPRRIRAELLRQPMC